MYDPKYPEAVSLHIRGPADDDQLPLITYCVFDNFVTERRRTMPPQALMLVAEDDFKRLARFTGQSVDNTYIAMPPAASSYQRGALVSLDSNEFIIVDYNRSTRTLVIAANTEDGLFLLDMAEAHDLQRQTLARFLRETGANVNVCSRCGGKMLYATRQYELSIATCEDCYYAIRLPGKTVSVPAECKYA